MGFFEEFRRAFFHDPSKALVALFWYVARRRVRARNLLRRISSRAPYVYQMWIRTVEQLDETVRQAPAAIAEWSYRPVFSIVLRVDSRSDQAALGAIINSVQSQCYPGWELLLVADAGIAPAALHDDQRIRWIHSDSSSDVATLKSGICEAQGGYILPLASGSQLSPAALFRMAEALQVTPDATVLYGDHDELDYAGLRAKPWFKSRWNRVMFLAQDYVSSAFALRADVARAVSGPATGVEGAASFGALLEITTNEDARIVHVPHILCHSPDAGNFGDQAARLDAVSRHIGSSGAVVRAGKFGLVDVSWALPSQLPLVTIIIPTRDKVELLRTCARSLLEATTYPNFEILIVDNGSVEPEAKRYLAELARDARVHVLLHDAPFNFSEINNRAAAEARGEYLCLLNNDTEIVSGEWLTELMRYAVKEKVGAVGAKLLYADGTLQHAGVVIGMGGAAGHAHRFLVGEDPGYFARAHVPHEVSAVTAACLVVAKEKFDAVCGLDAEQFKVAFNDVDFCLKVQRAGWKNIYVPSAVLLHHESKSRGSDISQKNIKRYMEELAVLQERWQTKATVDDLHHPSLDRANETYVIRL